MPSMLPVLVLFPHFRRRLIDNCGGNCMAYRERYTRQQGFKLRTGRMQATLAPAADVYAALKASGSGLGEIQGLTQSTFSIQVQSTSADTQI